MAERHVDCRRLITNSNQGGMMRRSLVVDVGLDKLQDLLLAMEEGDEISRPHAVAISGL